MESELIKSFMDLGVTGAFLVYLYIRNGKQETAMGKISETMDRNTRVLIKVAQKHGLISDADSMIEE